MKKFTISSFVFIIMFAIGAIGVNAQEAKNTGPEYTKEYINKVNRIAEGFAVGYEFGYHAPSFNIGLRCTVPAGDLWGFEFRLYNQVGVMGDEDMGIESDPAAVLVLGFYKRTPVLMGIIRAYAGGFFDLGYRYKAGDEPKKNPFNGMAVAFGDDKFALGGGGKFGFEVFISEKKSYFIEVGAGGPAHAYGYDTGAFVTAGANFFFGQ